MNKEQFFQKGLPKWPALLVKGEKVTPEQAKEILIRTDSFSFSSNDHTFSAELNHIVYDVKGKSWSLHEDLQKHFGFDWNEAWNYTEEKQKEVGVLDLQYLHNSQIVSSWIGGPHGWCDWNGNIQTSNYNIGKWPSIEEVYEEWVLIAKTFPFLKLRAQLMNCEACETDFENPEPVVEFVVENGEVTMIEPQNGQLLVMTDIDFKGRFLNPLAERGCTLPQFKDAYNFVKEKMKKL
jgi:hypothetical protein